MLGHGELTLVRKLDFGQRSNDFLDQEADDLALLDEYILVRTTILLGKLAEDVLNIWLVLVKLGLIGDSAHEFSDLSSDGVSTALGITRTLRLQLDEHSEEGIALRGSEVNFSVRVHTEGERCLRWQLLFDVFNVLLVSGRSWALEHSLVVSEGEHVGLIKKCVIHEVE